MKLPLLLPLFCLIVTTAQAAMPPKDFADVPWGASPDEAQKIITQRGAQFEARPSNARLLVFSGGKFAGQRAVYWELKFDGGGFFDGLVVLASEGRAEPLYREMIAQISSKYGSANEKQVGHRLPPHFVLGLGWRSSGSTKPPLHADWLTESALSGTAVAISAWVQGNEVRIQYQHQAAKNSHGSPGTVGKKRPGDDL